MTLDLMGPFKEEFSPCMDRLELIDDGFLGRGYRDAVPKTRHAMRIAGQNGLVLDSAFSAKAFASLLAALPAFPDRRLLFWNTHDQRRKPAVGGTI
jgi:hypothetical protein